MKKRILFFIAFVPFFLHAQNHKIQGLIVDSTNQTPVDFANIGIEGKNLGTVCNDSGFFKLKIPNKFLKDSLTFSRIGYSTRKIRIDELVNKESLEINLVLKSTEIQEAKIVSKKLRTRIKGNRTRSAFIMPAFYADTSRLGRELGIVIRLPQRQIFIKDFNCHILSVKPDSILFRLNMYEFNKGKIGDNILEENIFFTISKKDRGDFKIDLRDYKITVSNDILIGIENIKGYVSKGSNLKLKNDEFRYDRILFSGTVAGSKCFFRDVSLSNWEEMPAALSPGFWVTILK